MKAGRPIKGSELVNNLDGDEESKARLKMILDTIAGRITIKEACEKLDISESRFYKLRTDILQSALINLEPKPKGRPGLQVDEKHKEIEELKDELRRLRLDNKVLELKSQFSALAPHLLNTDGSINENELDKLLKGDSKKKLIKKKKKKKLQKKSRKRNR